MTYALIYVESLKKTLKKIAKSNPLLIRKLSALQQELAEHPRTGTGKPEPLKGYGGIRYSRRLTGKDRIIYDIYDDKVEVLILELEGHYDDK